MLSNYYIKKRKTYLEDRISSNIEINDIFDELSNENKRLLNELLFANKCLKSLILYKTFVDFISHKFKNYLNTNECQKFEKLKKDIEDVKEITKLSDETLRFRSFRQKVVDSVNERQTDKSFEYKLKNRNQRKENVLPKIIDSEDSEESTESIEKHNYDSAKEVVNCQFCLQLFISSDDYKRHLKVHTNSTVKPFVCYIPCGRSFSSLQDLKYHSNDCHSDQSIRLKTIGNPVIRNIKLINPSIDSNPVKNQLKESLQTNVSKIFNEIAENVVNDNKNIDNSDHDSDDGRHSDNFEDNDSNNISDFPFKQRIESNSTQNDLKLKTKNKPIKCPIVGCNETFVAKISKQHLLRVHKNSELNCSVDGCNQSFESYDEFLQHLWTHPLYSKRGSKTEAMKPFFKTERRDGQTSYICLFENCGKRFPKYSGVYIHNRRVHKFGKLGRRGIVKQKEVVLKCQTYGCGYECHSNYDLRKHKKTIHGRDDKPSVDSNEVINQLKESLQTNAPKITENVVNDNRINDNSKNYSNDVGFEDNDSEDSDYIPTKTSDEEENHSSDGDFQFKQRNESKTQISLKVMTKSKSIKCPINGCNQTFIERLSRQHFMSDHKGSDLNCAVDGCNQTFESYHEFVEHLWTHPLYSDQLKPGIKPKVVEPFFKTERRDGQIVYICSFENCGKSFGRYLSVYKHYTMVHKQGEIGRNARKVLTKQLFKSEIRDGHTLFICPAKDCGKSFNGYRNVSGHYRRAHNSKEFVFKCQIKGCDYECKSLFDIFIHKKTIHGTEDIHLEEELLSQSQSTSASQKKDYKIGCRWPGCKHMSKSPQMSGKHFRKIHGKGLKVYVCDYNNCGVVSIGLQTHKEHIKGHKDYKFKCSWPECLFQTKNIQTMRDHRKSHTNPEVFFCEFCKKEFTNRNSLHNHETNFHRTTNEVFKCTFEGCGKTFKRKTGLKAHDSKFHRLIKFKCGFEGCTKQYGLKSQIITHQKNIHSGRQYACVWPGCEYKGKTKYQLREHEFIHKPEVTRYVCEWPECGKVLRHQTNYMYHMRAHKNDMRYSCEWPGCDFRTVTHWGIASHRKTHKT